MPGEFEAIDRIRRLFPDPPAGEVWIGDDAAVLPGGLLVAADALVYGRHVLPDAPLDDLGWKAIATNASDIAAMGGRPTHCLVTVAGPADTNLDLLYAGIAEATAVYGCPVVGGDLVNASELTVSVTVLGTTDGRAPVLRSGARPGDLIYVTGPLGGAAASGYRVRPVARVAEGIAAAVAGATAMIDVSDGLFADLNHLLEASGVGVGLAPIPIAPGATAEQAMGGGDDYELVFAAPAHAEVAGIRIGRCTDDVSQRPTSTGWEHTWR
ncbi:MAG: thiamine-monophosphate kinase [Actinomycetota bacterium]|jgi:thiamine-monophosphate kinase|nr:thiamine-monophosphate kinase [Actinomycetota bacterium]